jgi:hypothetical protein
VAIDFSIPAPSSETSKRIAALGVNWWSAPPAGRNTWSASKNRRAARHRPGLEPQLFGRRERVLPHRREAARLLANEPEYEAWAWEIHHSAKKDAPSGTLLKLVDEMRAAGYERARRRGANRAGAHPRHARNRIRFAADTITLRHTARSREGFARGA